MKTTEEMIEVMQAHSEGKKIENCLAAYPEEKWSDCDHPEWNWVTCDYRVKKESTYRPYESVNEMLDDFCERCREHGMTVPRSPMGEPLIWLLSKGGNGLKLVTGLNEGSETCKLYLNGSAVTFKYIFDNYTYKDGSPCGKKVTE